jgi:thiosulfate/3-mercaptopyruvate sulfurtransferase
VSETSGNPFYEVAESWFTFMIGRNPRQSEDRPYDYVPLRHVPIDPESFAYYGDNLLPDFDAQNTWRYATPHNIQRNTPQTESCLNCHENPDIFLTADKVASEELEANMNVIVEEIPESKK